MFWNAGVEKLTPTFSGEKELKKKVCQVCNRFAGFFKLIS